MSRSSDAGDVPAALQAAHRLRFSTPEATAMGTAQRWVCELPMALGQIAYRRTGGSIRPRGANHPDLQHSMYRSMLQGTQYVGRLSRSI